MKRRKMSYKKSNAQYKRGKRVHKRNLKTLVSRGGFKI